MNETYDKEFWEKYLPKLNRHWDLGITYTSPVGFLNAFNNSPKRSSACYVHYRKGGLFYDIQSKCLQRNYSYTTIPILLGKFEKKKVNKPTNDKSTNKRKTMIDNIIESNKEALTISAKLATGKTANTMFLRKMVGHFPWYTKMFAKKHKVEDNVIAKLVTAQTALALASHFAGDNKKLTYVAEAMVQDAMVDLTVNSAILDNLLTELDGLITLPDEFKS